MDHARRSAPAPYQLASCQSWPTDVYRRRRVSFGDMPATPSDTKIQTLTLDDQQHGSLTIPALGSTVKSAVLVISALAPTTTETSSYRVLARPAR